MNDYVQNMRKYIGNAPLLLVAAGAIIYKGRKILLQKRSDNGMWGIHGGSMELGENIEDTLKRELKEEIGITPTNLRFYKIVSGEAGYWKYPNGDEIYCVNVIFLCDKYNGVFKIDNCEVKELKWFDVDDLPINEIDACNAEILKDIDKVI